MLIRCLHCGTDIDSISSYCDQCGTKVQPDIDLTVCEQCGSKFLPESDLVFCINCGNKLIPDIAPDIETDIQQDIEVDHSHGDSGLIPDMPSSPPAIESSFITKNLPNHAFQLQLRPIAFIICILMIASGGFYYWYSSHISEVKANPSGVSSSPIASNEDDSTLPSAPPPPSSTAPATALPLEIQEPQPKPSEPAAPAPITEIPAQNAPQKVQPTVTKRIPVQKPSVPQKTHTTMEQINNQKLITSHAYSEFISAVGRNAANSGQKKAAYKNNTAELGHMLYRYYVLEGKGSLVQARTEMRSFITSLEGSGSPRAKQELVWALSTVH